MYSPRRILITVLGSIVLWMLVRHLPNGIYEDVERGISINSKMRLTPRPKLKLKNEPSTAQVPWKTKDSWARRTEMVKEAFLHAYRGYEQYAPFPHDELMPLTNQGVDNLNGWGLTLIDSLDTMILLGLKDDFNRALQKVKRLDFAMPKGEHAPFFETVIRYLGGLLSAHALSGEPILLAKAEELGHRLLPAFNTTSGMPQYAVNTETKSLFRKAGNAMLFAEVASCQMEFKYLAYLTGREEFFLKADRIMDHLKITQPKHGMWPTAFDIQTGRPNNAHHSIGAWADSAYEYLLKQYLLSGKTEHRLARLYMNAVRGILGNLVFLSPKRKLLYITDTTGLIPSRKFEHLSCFFPGLLALGVETLPDSVMSQQERELHMWAAEGLAHTCWIMYADQPSGLGAEVVIFDENMHGEGHTASSSDVSKEKWVYHLERWDEDGRPRGKPPGVGNAGPPLTPGSDEITDYTLYTSAYLLRPETLESMFIMYRTTKNVKWRDRGWQIWEAIESKTKTFSGYASVSGIDFVDPPREDSMPSYFLAETIKYAYLLALDEDPWPVDHYVLNTEAHPFPVFKWDDWHRRRLGIDDGPILR